MYDVSQHHRSELEKNHKRMEEIIKYFPTNYWEDEEYRRLADENTRHQYAIKDYETWSKILTTMTSNELQNISLKGYVNPIKNESGFIITTTLANGHEHVFVDTDFDKISGEVVKYLLKTYSPQTPPPSNK